MTTRFFGKPIERIEDPALLMGQGKFTDDIDIPGTLHAAFVRSPYAHARILGVDCAPARGMPGVHLVLAAAELPENLRDRRIPLDVPSPFIQHPLTQTPLAVNEVCFCGEAVAVVVADTRQLAEDTIQAVMVDYEPLSAISDFEQSLGDGAAKVHVGLPDNMAAKFSLSHGNIDSAFANAAHVVAEEYFQHRGTGCPLEGRAVLANYDRLADSLMMWSATQSPHGIKRALLDYFDLPDTKMRVVAPDVGGGFGPKLLVYPEEIVIPYCSSVLGRPVKWTEDRREHLMCTAQERDQLWTVKLALDKDGKILGLRGHLLHDTGAFLPWGIIMPYISATTLPGPYVIPAFRIQQYVAVLHRFNQSSCPRYIRPTQLHRSASSIYGVHTKIVTPFSARRLPRRFQNSRRLTGSTPSVGSSNITTCGSWIRLQASASFFFIPPDSCFAGRSVKSERPANPRSSGTRRRWASRLTPWTFAKKRMFSMTVRSPGSANCWAM